MTRDPAPSGEPAESCAPPSASSVRFSHSLTACSSSPIAADGPPSAWVTSPSPRSATA
ncbi:hypothetical protein [Actinomadura verrucosospora]|uniref:hypothetical protein n=1 Tax=Actinomadura verrucosospora TaxID=46165 RepID=UPI0015648529|nr:hypothetical protein [Actinomadura verrucosospora]